MHVNVATIQKKVVSFQIAKSPLKHITLLETNVSCHILSQGTFEDDFPKVGYVSSLEGRLT